MEEDSLLDEVEAGIEGFSGGAAIGEVGDGSGEAGFGTFDEDGVFGVFGAVAHGSSPLGWVVVWVGT